MYCVIQEVELKKSVLNGEYKELEAYLNEWIMNGQQVKFYSYRFTGGRFERTIKKAYKISVHKSYREKGRVKKKQWSICTMDYYCIATNGAGIHDFCDIESKAKAIGITEEELCDIIYKKLDQLEYKIKSEYQETEEYKTHKKHEEIINKYNIDKKEFEKKYGKDSYDKCYDIFGKLREPELLDFIKRQYEAHKERERSYYKNSKGNYNNNSNSSYYNNKQSNYNEADKDKYKKIYKTLAKAYHPDIAKDDGEMMKLVNQLKEEWGI
ncbi:MULTISPECIES: hypothetical protein [Clostridium]|uniref:DnaJ domain n=2 Tax=Clostridiaceae TaxID=31979 RepID=A0A174HL29_9CLOT|nr:MULTISPECIES: hypothetical protein [Clostridium]MDU3723212.1 hypothetical protein [Clostridium celatum]CUO75584.1 Uncharacterised protein [Clostridium disporicum]SCJ47552.1 Uncharacterised protein [uncultured Clostridium sp.]